MATTYHGIGGRIQHCRAGIGDQTSDYDFLAWTYPAFDDVACEFLDPELCPSTV